MARYQLYGLMVESDFPLPGSHIDEVQPEVTIHDGGHRPIPDELPPGRVLARIKHGPIHYYSTESDGGFTVRYPGTCDVEFDAALQTVTVYVADADARPLTEVLLGANVFAKLLTLRGECILHASAVQSGDGAIAFVGSPGAGKSTLAGLLCGEGATLVTDDVLWLKIAADGFRCVAGTSQLRLRGPAAVVAESLDGAVATSQDGRTTVALKQPLEEPPLATIVFPQPSRTQSEIEISRLSAGDALLRLTMFPRILGWEDASIIERSFRCNAQLAREVPAYVSTIPWGPPFRDDIASSLIALARTEVADKH